MSVQTTGNDILVIFASLEAVNLVIKRSQIGNSITAFLTINYFHNSSGTGTQVELSRSFSLQPKRFKLGPVCPQGLIASNYPAEGTQPEKCYSITIITFLD